jgi:excisionase family DNA binding protein
MTRREAPSDADGAWRASTSARAVARRSERDDGGDLAMLLDRFLDRLVVELANRIEERLERLAAEHGSDGPHALDVKQAAARLGVSPTTMHELVMSGQVASVKVGRRRLIAASTIDRMLAGDTCHGEQIRGAIGEQLRGIRRERSS